ncbi:hypothetical protein ZWY2020_020014 [Hordeum vulgare]|nr:hypothetical protein ZWY2020_020014 [Hordeum vulgare]
MARRGEGAQARRRRGAATAHPPWMIDEYGAGFRCERSSPTASNTQIWRRPAQEERFSYTVCVIDWEA